MLCSDRDVRIVGCYDALVRSDPGSRRASSLQRYGNTDIAQLFLEHGARMTINALHYFKFWSQSGVTM